MQFLAGAMAARAGRRPDDFAVRTIAGAVVGAMMAVLAAVPTTLTPTSLR